MAQIILNLEFNEILRAFTDNVQNFSHIFLGARPVKFSSA